SCGGQRRSFTGAGDQYLYGRFAGRGEFWSCLHRYRPGTIGARDRSERVAYGNASGPWTRWCVEMSFTLGGKTARELGIVMLRESQRPILPGTVDKTMSIPGR